MGYIAWPVAVCLLVMAVLVAVDSKKPHIIMFVADDVGNADYEGVDPSMHTPNLLRLAQRGVTLSQSYTLQSGTPTRTALLTGKLVVPVVLFILVRISSS